MNTVFTGFDSAWGNDNDGAVCDMILREDGALQLAHTPVSVGWDGAINRIGQYTKTKLHIWAIDQPICVANQTGCRPVERDLATALMADFQCGAHSSNLSNPCWGPSARIWEFLRELQKAGYKHNPMEVPGAKEGKYYFECYPHPALLGLFDLERIVKYKVHHNDSGEWRRLLTLLRKLEERQELPVVGIKEHVPEGLDHTKSNEDKLDAIICAYVAASWWRFGPTRSSMVGDTTSGYTVTPHSDRTLVAFRDVFADRMNQVGGACAPPVEAPSHLSRPEATPGVKAARPSVTRPTKLPPEPQNGWRSATLCATDTTNLWRQSRGRVINEWMDPMRLQDWQLWVRFLGRDGQPAVAFVPFDAQGVQQSGMKAAKLQMNRELWHFLVEGATRHDPLYFDVQYCYQPLA